MNPNLIITKAFEETQEDNTGWPNKGNLAQGFLYGGIKVDSSNIEKRTTLFLDLWGVLNDF